VAGALPALPRHSSWIRGRGGREKGKMGEDESGDGRRHGKERVREWRGEEDRGGQGKGGEKAEGEKREGGMFPPVLNSQLKHRALVRIRTQRREQ